VLSLQVGAAAQMVGLEYVGFRNEQAASYAAGAASYLTGFPQVCLCVSGPGVIHGVAGLANAWANCWPMLLIGGAPASSQAGMGGFQESATLDACRPFTKYQARVDSVARIPFYVARALHIARSGRPGPVYLELPAELVGEHIELAHVNLGPQLPKSPPRTLAEPKNIQEAISLLRNAKSPLVIVGKGAAWSRAEAEARQLIEKLKVPFLATPMGKGVVPDDHELSVAAGRSAALAGADVVVLLGARLNWILHFGLPPRFKADVKIIQVDIQPEELHTNVPTAVGLVGDVQAVCKQLIDAAGSAPFPAWKDWKSALAADVSKNNATVGKMMQNESIPMSYFRVFKSIRDTIPKDAVIVSEGANSQST
jgi:2-hydroxyacyl-CoA lyase 1